MIDAAAPVSLADQPAHLRITGLVPRDEVTVTSEMTDQHGTAWIAHAVFRADGHGTVTLDTTAPLSGSYRGVDGMGLFWSMNPPHSDPDHVLFALAPVISKPSVDVRISVSSHGRRLATRTLTREWIGAGVTARPLTLAADKVLGELFLPAAGTARHPAVLLFGGSEGGNSQQRTAALLASHGYPALSVGYFGMPGLPPTLQGIPLEYFTAAAHLLAAQPQADPAHLIVYSGSRGSEAALLLAQDYPNLIHGAVVSAPSAQVNPGLVGDAWSIGGKPIADNGTAIALTHVSGPVLAVTGADDRLWPSPGWTRQIDQELTASHDPHPHQALIYPDAGHWAADVPYFPEGTHTVATDGHTEDLGGTRAGDAAAQEAYWPHVLAFLAALDH